MTTEKALESFTKAVEDLWYDRYNRAIVEALLDSPTLSLRYNRLFIETNRKFAGGSNLTGPVFEIRDKKDQPPLKTKSQKKMSLKTFNDHLKTLAKNRVVKRIRKSRYNVRYQLWFGEGFNVERMKTIKQIREGGMLLNNGVERIKEIVKNSKISDELAAKFVVDYFFAHVDLTTLNLLCLGVNHAWKGNFANFAVTVAETYRSTVIAIAVTSLYLSSIPIAGEYLRRVLDERTERLKRQVEGDSL
jgi:hypothetical protein